MLSSQQYFSLGLSHPSHDRLPQPVVAPAFPLSCTKVISTTELNVPLSSNPGDPFQSDPFAEQQTASTGKKKSLC